MVSEGDGGGQGGGGVREVEHVAGQGEGEGDEVGGEGMLRAVRAGAKDIDALLNFEPVAGEAAEGLVHGGKESDGFGAGGGAGFDHQAGEVAGFGG